MEGPSLFLAQQQLRPFKGRTVSRAAGNTKAFDPAMLNGLVLRDVFAWGKHLVLQFKDFALRFHFLMFGTFEAEVDGVWVTGDYRRSREPRLSLEFENGQFKAYSCSVQIIDSPRAKRAYDFGIDIMSRQWDEARVRKLMRQQPDEQLCDVLLDQTVFAGVGNIIKNEVLAIAHLAPTRRVRTVSTAKQRELVAETRAFSRQFYLWRRKFLLLKNLRTHRKTICRHCGGKLKRVKTGKRDRWSYWCPKDQP
jgi:endonuclease-8